MDVRMQAPEGATSCGHQGVSYEVDEDGAVTVPEEAVADLMSHGYEPIGETVEEVVVKKSRRNKKAEEE